MNNEIKLFNQYKGDRYPFNLNELG